MKSKIYDIIELGEEYKEQNKTYTLFMFICIILSLIPLCFKEDNYYFRIIDKITVTVFIIDYLLRLYTADIKYNNGALSYIKYPFSAMAIIDLLSQMINKADI